MHSKWIHFLIKKIQTACLLRGGEGAVREMNGVGGQVWKPRWHCGLTRGRGWDEMMGISEGVPGKRPGNPLAPKGSETRAGSTPGLGSLYYNNYFF